MGILLHDKCQNQASPFSVNEALISWTFEIWLISFGITYQMSRQSKLALIKTKTPLAFSRFDSICIASLYSSLADSVEATLNWSFKTNALSELLLISMANELLAYGVFQLLAALSSVSQLPCSHSHKFLLKV